LIIAENQMSVNAIIPRQGQLYSNACAEVLRRYISLKPDEKREMKKTSELKEAYTCFIGFRTYQAKAFFGEDIVDKMETICF